ncbi:MAG TPA: Flp family type IVb pilin [Stellaceae bacterium]|nr:Flp family type IVb pilin [Stellaceae bacterium]
MLFPTEQNAIVASHSNKGGRPAVSLFLLLRELAAERRGVTAIEYGLIAALIAIAAVAVMGQIGTDLSSTFNTVAGDL